MLQRTLTTPNATITIIDNRPMFRIGIRQAIEKIDPAIQVLDTEHYSEFKPEVDTYKWDIILMGTKSLSNAEIIGHIRRFRLQNPKLKIALYDHRNSIDSVITFFQEKIDGYLTENFSLENLNDCILKLSDDKLYVNPEIANQLLTFKLDYTPQKKTTLSEMENRVAQFLLKGVGVSNIAKTLDRSTSTISTVKAKIFKKMRVDNIIDLARVLESA